MVLSGDRPQWGPRESASPRLLQLSSDPLPQATTPLSQSRWGLGPWEARMRQAGVEEGWDEDPGLSSCQPLPSVLSYLFIKKKKKIYIYIYIYKNLYFGFEP